MGCCPLQTSLALETSAEERVFVYHESSLGFQIHSVRHIATAISAHSDSGRVPSTELKVLLAALGTGRGPAVEGLFRELAREDGSVEERKLKVLGGLLGAGSDRDRAVALLEAVSDKHSAVITQDQASALFDLIFSISAGALPRLAQGLAPTETTLHKAQVDRSVTALMTAKATLVRRCQNTLMVDSDRLAIEEACQSLLQTEYLRVALTPHGARQLLRREDKRTLHPVAI